MVQIDRYKLRSLLRGAGVNKVSVRNANDPMPTGQGEVGTILLSLFEDGHYSSQKTNMVTHHNVWPIVKFVFKVEVFCFGCRQVMIPWLVEGGCVH